jgi:transposase
MHIKYKKPDFTNQTIYVGIDVHKKSWNVSILTDDILVETFNQPPEPSKLVAHLRRSYPGATYRAVYEAGYFGYWIYDALRNDGIECEIANPLDIPTKDKERRHKSDRIDSRKLGRGLRNGDLELIFVPPKEYRYARTLTRGREQFIRKQTRCKNQIKALLNYYGYNINVKDTKSHWSRLFIKQLQELKVEDQSVRSTLDNLITELLYLRELTLNFTKQIRTLSRTPLFQEEVRLLDSIPGISELSAMVILSEIVSIDRFKSLDKLASYFGLVPTCHSSGESEVDGELTERGNSYLRYIIIELAWIAIRKDPALLEKFQKLSRRMKKQVAIVAIAKNLLNRIRYVLKNKKPYVKAVSS